MSDTLDDLRHEKAEYRDAPKHCPVIKGDWELWRPIQRALAIAERDVDRRIDERVKEISYEFHPRRSVLAALKTEFECYGETDEVRQTRPAIEAAVAELDSELSRHQEATK